MDRPWFFNNNGINTAYWNVLRWGNLLFGVLPLTILQAIAIGIFCSTSHWSTVLLVAWWDSAIAVAMFHISSSVLDVQPDAGGVTLTSFLGRRRRVAWNRIGGVRVRFARSAGPALVICEICGKTQNRYSFGIAHPGPGTNAETFLLSKLAQFAPSQLTLEQLPASWRDIGVFNAWFLSASLIGVGVAALLGRYHLEPGVLVPIPAAIVLTVALRLRRRSRVKVELGVQPNWDNIPRSCRAWVRALVSRTDPGTLSGETTT
jgi:hypothetical protein